MTIIIHCGFRAFNNTEETRKHSASSNIGEKCKKTKLPKIQSTKYILYTKYKVFVYTLPLLSIIQVKWEPYHHRN